MTKNIAAYTANSHPYPAFMSLNREENGEITLTIREPAKPGPYSDKDCGNTVTIVLPEDALIVKAVNAYGSTDALRSALVEGRQAAVELASLMREGAHDKEEIKWCKVVDRIDAALSGSPHASDCAVHNGPALPAGECDCDVSGSPAPSTEGLREWQPIETAPKDGTEVLVFRDDCGVLLARWTSAGELLTDAEAEASGMDEDALHQEDWFYADIMRGGRMEGIEVPTHWMPLPPAPDAARTALAGVTAPSEVDAK